MACLGVDGLRLAMNLGFLKMLRSARETSGHRALRKGAHVKQKLPDRRMREHPDLEQLKRQKELLNGFAKGDASATAQINAHYDMADAARFALHDAQLVVARSYGF